MTRARPWGKGLGFSPSSLAGSTRNELRGDEALFLLAHADTRCSSSPCLVPRRALSIATLREHLSGEGQLCFKRPHFFPGASLAYSSASTKRFPMTNVSPEPKIEPRRHTRGDPEHTACSPRPWGCLFSSPCLQTSSLTASTSLSQLLTSLLLLLFYFLNALCSTTNFLGTNHRFWKTRC